MVQDELRIVCLLPSITEIVAVLGLSDKIVGITHECDHPEDAVQGAIVVTKSDISPYSMSQGEINEAVVGSLLDGHSLYALKAEELKDLRPTHIFTQSLCDICAVSYPLVLDTCARIMGGPQQHDESGPADAPNIVSLEPTDLQQMLQTIKIAAGSLGSAYVPVANKVTAELNEGFQRIRTVAHVQPTRPRVVFMEWHDPIFDGGHWIPEMLEIAGGKYSMTEKGQRSKQITKEEFVAFEPEIILVGPCGFAVERAKEDTLKMYEYEWWRNMRAVKNGKVFAVDANSYFARPGPRLLQGTAIMAACLHGECVAEELGPELVPAKSYERIPFPPEYQ